MTHKLAILIPYFNEKKIRSFLNFLFDSIPSSELRAQTIQEIYFVLVNDGSGSEVDRPDVRRVDGILPIQSYLLVHPFNLGQGAALQTGLEYARDVLGADLFVTMDSDGQHDVSEVPSLIAKLTEGNFDIVFGNRFVNGSPQGITLSRRIILKLATHLEKVLTGLDLGDAHNGFRVFNRNFASKFSLHQNRMAHATEIKLIVRHYGFRFAETPVTLRYSPETLRRGQSNLGSLSILRDLIKSYLFESPIP